MLLPGLLKAGLSNLMVAMCFVCLRLSEKLSGDFYTALAPVKQEQDASEQGGEEEDTAGGDGCCGQARVLLVYRVAGGWPQDVLAPGPEVARQRLPAGWELAPWWGASPAAALSSTSARFSLLSFSPRRFSCPP